MGASSTDASTKGPSKSPKKKSKSPPVKGSVDSKQQLDTSAKTEGLSNAEATKPLAPPPRPGQQQGSDTPDFFSGTVGGSLSLEPNPFEQSFGGAPPETPGGTKLPPVAALTSPSSLLPGSGVTPFGWGTSSLRTGPLSPAMLSGPANDYFSDTHHLRGGFPTPNESSLRTGLTPGGSGSMFPAPSPNSQAIFAQLAAGGATPSTLDFHRTALSAAKQNSTGVKQPTSQPIDMPNGVTSIEDTKPQSGTYDPHDNDAANGLYLLAQGRNGTQPTGQYPVAAQDPSKAHPAPVPGQAIDTSPQMASINGASIGSGSARGVSEAGSAMSDESEEARPNTRAKGKKNAATTKGRRKAEEPLTKAPANKKAKTNAAAAASAAAAAAAAAAVSSGSIHDMDDMSDDDEYTKTNEDGTKSKPTDEEKRKNFLERNRVAALKCRQRKKQWLANLQTKVEMYSSENDALATQITQLREEVVNLKTLLLAHKDCPITQQQGLHSAAYLQVVEPFGSQMNPYGMAAPLPGQGVLSGQPAQRRYS